MFSLLRLYIVHFYLLYHLFKLINQIFVLSLPLTALFCIIAFWVTYCCWNKQCLQQKQLWHSDQICILNDYSAEFFGENKKNKICNIEKSKKNSEKIGKLSNILKRNIKIEVASRDPVTIPKKLNQIILKKIITSPVNKEPLRNAVIEQIKETFNRESEDILLKTERLKISARKSVIPPKRRQNIQIVLRKMTFYDKGEEFTQNRLIYLSILKMDFSVLGIEAFY